MKGKEILKAIKQNVKLRRSEQDGFVRGEKKGKTMDVSDYVLMASLRKQMLDLEKAWATYYVTTMPTRKQIAKQELEKKIADLRNVAGCLFLKLGGGLE
jgi:hypothetical protein